MTHREEMMTMDKKKKEDSIRETTMMSIDDAIDILDNGKFQHRILLAAGLCFAADAMEILLLSFLSVVLRAQWDLTDGQTGLLTSSVFIGALCGTLILGPLGDKIGRKPVFVFTACIIAVFGFATAAANNFAILVVLRFLVGFGVGGLTIPFDTLAEFIPSTHRGSNLLAIEYFWTIGTLLTPVAAYYTLGNNGEEGSDIHAWRCFVILCAVPCLLSTIVGVVFVPESPRWLLTQGRHDEALAILKSAATCNGKDPATLYPEGTRIVDDVEAEVHSSNFMELLSPRWRRTTLFLWFAWCGFAFVYYGTIITVTMVFSSTQEDVGDQNGNGDELTTYTFDYGAILTAASSEVAGLTLVLFTIDRLGRIPTQSLCHLLGGISVFTLCLFASKQQQQEAQDDASYRARLMVMSFLSRLFFMGSSCSTWVATAEIFTTEIRTTGHSTSNAIARIGASLSPYLVTSSKPMPVIGSVLLIVSICTAYACWNLPETAGKHMGCSASTTVGSSNRKSTASVDNNDNDDEQGPSYELL